MGVRDKGMNDPRMERKTMRQKAQQRVWRGSFWVRSSTTNLRENTGHGYGDQVFTVCVVRGIHSCCLGLLGRGSPSEVFPEQEGSRNGGRGRIVEGIELKNINFREKYFPFSGNSIQGHKEKSPWRFCRACIIPADGCYSCKYFYSLKQLSQ